MGEEDPPRAALFRPVGQIPAERWRRISKRKTISMRDEPPSGKQFFDSQAAPVAGPGFFVALAACSLSQRRWGAFPVMLGFHDGDRAGQSARPPRLDDHH